MACLFTKQSFRFVTCVYLIDAIALDKIVVWFGLPSVFICIFFCMNVWYAFSKTSTIVLIHVGRRNLFTEEKIAAVRM